MKSPLVLPAKIKQTTITNEYTDNKYFVSTVYDICGSGKYETMVFAIKGKGANSHIDWTDLDCRRCDTKEEALEDHAALCYDYAKSVLI